MWNMSITTIVTNCFSQYQVIICIGYMEAINNMIHVICFMILFKTFMAQFTSNNDSCCSRFKTNNLDHQEDKQFTKDSSYIIKDICRCGQYKIKLLHVFYV